MKSVQNNIPELRFPEFSDKWKIKKLGEVAKFSKGKGISKSEIVVEGKNDCIRYGELYTLYGETISEVYSKTNNELDKQVVSEANDVIIPASGETQIDIATASCVLKDGIILGGDLNIIKTKNNGVFLSYYLNSKKKIDIARLSQGISVVHLYSSQLSSLKLNLPPIPEQQKIAAFLTTVDAKITQLKHKKELLTQYKKGVMQQIFNQEIRFKDDEGNVYPKWKVKLLGEICKLQGGYAFKSSQFKKSGIPIIRISNISNKHNYIEKDKLVYYNPFPNDENYILTKNDLIIAMSGATTGKSSVFNLENKAYVNQRVGVFRVKKGLSNSYLTQFVFSSIFLNQLDKVLVAGAQPNISSKDIEQFKIPFPCLEEQTEIADFLSSIDAKIDQVAIQLEKTKAFKNGLLQQLFV